LGAANNYFYLKYLLNISKESNLSKHQKSYECTKLEEKKNPKAEIIKIKKLSEMLQNKKKYMKNYKNVTSDQGVQ
jgi:hypothetical protein